MSISAIGGFSMPANFQAMREQMFSKLDQDASGAISKDEFKAGPADAPKGIKPPSKLEEMFAKIDSDGNGELSKDELESFKPPQPPQFSSSTMQSLLSVQEQGEQDSILDLISSDSGEEADEETISIDQTMRQFLEQILSRYASKTADELSTLTVA